MARIFFRVGALSAGLSVIMGSWGAHSEVFDEVQSLWIEKGSRYQMYHSLALLCISLLLATHRRLALMAMLAGFSFVGGILLFSGSLYFMAVSTIDAGYVTPAGGILFLLGWLFLAFSAPGKK